MKISGFTFVRNAIKYTYPFIESINSLLPLVDELVINVGVSEDNTLEELKKIKSDKIKIFETNWNDNDVKTRRREIFSEQTNLALERITGDWGIYLQADEVINEKDYDIIYRNLEKNLSIDWIEGFRFKYLHFDGDYYTLNPWLYRREIRIVRNNPQIRSLGDAFSFIKKNGMPLITKDLNAFIYHYGWARKGKEMLEKIKNFDTYYYSGETLNEKMKHLSSMKEYDFGNRDTHIPFKKKHPVVMEEILKSETRLFIPKIHRWLNPKFYYRVFNHWSLNKFVKYIKNIFIRAIFYLGLKKYKP